MGTCEVGGDIDGAPDLPGPLPLPPEFPEQVDPGGEQQEAVQQDEDDENGGFEFV